MSKLEGARRVARDIASEASKQTKRAQLEIQNRQVERKINREYSRIGRALHPLIESGQLSTDNSEVQSATRALAALRNEFEERQAQIARLLGKKSQDGSDKSS